MKKTLFGLSFIFLLFSCSSDDSTNNDGENNENPIPTPPTYAMTASINGVAFNANNPFGTNLYTEHNMWDYYPTEEYVRFIGRQDGLWGNPEINIWLKRDLMTPGSYTLYPDDGTNPGTHAIDLIDNSNDELENTVTGTVTILEVNTNTKIVKGTFEFTTTDDYNFIANPVINYTVTEGTFYYQYED